MAVEAVIGEPVSTRHFPVSRENTGKSQLWWLEMPWGSSSFHVKIQLLAT
jgi:hypothetical protein